MVPTAVAWLFWDVDPATIDLDRHQDYVLERIMSRGDFEAMRWLTRTYSKSTLADHLTRRGSRLAPRERAFWSLIAGVKVAAATGGGRPDWASRPA